MTPPIRPQLWPALRRLGAAGVRAWKQDTALSALGAELQQAPQPALVEVSARILRAQTAALPAQPKAALALLELARAVSVVQLSAAPDGQISETLAADGDRPLRSLRVSIADIAQARRIIERESYDQLWRVNEAVWADLRLSSVLIRALDHKKSPRAAILAALSAQAQWTAIRDSFGRSLIGDHRRLSLLSEAQDSRARQIGRELAERLLKAKPSPKLRAAAYRCLAGAPEALPLLLAAAQKGPQGARRAAFYALSRRREPEALQAILTELGRPSPEYKGVPMSFWLLREALPYINAPEARAKLRAGLQEAIADLPPETDRWSPELWAEALLAGPVDDADRALLCALKAERWLPPRALYRLWEVSSPDMLRARLSEREPSIEPSNEARITDELLLLWAMYKLPPEELFERLSPGLGGDCALYRVLIGHSLVTRGGEKWWYEEQAARHPHSLDFLSAVTLDPRWWERAVELELPTLIGALLPKHGAKLAIDWLQRSVGPDGHESESELVTLCRAPVLQDHYFEDVDCLVYGLKWTGTQVPTEVSERLVKENVYTPGGLLSLLGPADLSWLIPWVKAEAARSAEERHKSLTEIKRRAKQLRAEADDA